MAKRKKKQKAPAPRLARDKAIELRVTEVENPDWRPDRDGEAGFPRLISPAANVRESAVQTLFVRGELTMLQKTSADMFRRYFEAFSAENVAAIDYSRDKVDGSAAKAPVSQSRIKARRELARCKLEIGTRNYRLLVSVCGQGKALGDLFITNRQRTTAADNLRDSLYDIAIMWGLATGNSQRRQRQSTKLAS